ncbi:MAG: hypothetical protein U0105_23705 [Candidatus Obscuribacterales bacterium]
MGDLGQAVENNLAVAGKVLPTIHTAVWDELSNDWENHRGALVAKGAVATGVGIGLGLLCSRAPVLGRGIAGMTQLTRMTTSGLSLIQMASAADTDTQREQSAGIARRGIAGEAALMIETLPAALVGAKGGGRAPGGIMGWRRGWLVSDGGWKSGSARPLAIGSHTGDRFRALWRW